MAIAAVSGTEAQQKPTVATGGNGLKLKLLAAAGRWLVERPAIAIALVLAFGVPGYVPGYFELERGERREMRAAHAAEERENRQTFVQANAVLVDRLGKLVSEQTRAIDELAHELRKWR